MSLLTPDLIGALQRLDACAISNAVETFDCRLRNEGFVDGRIHAMFDDLDPMVGHAVTVRIHCSSPPAVGRTYWDRTDWWNYIVTVPSPRIVVVEDADERAGLGAFIGDVHANILTALGCVGCVTNGSVRDLPAVHAIQFQMFAAHAGVSHAYVHIVDFGGPVTIGGLCVQSGDVLYGDRHGVLNIPLEVVAQVPAVAERMLAAERKVVALCQSGPVSLEQLGAAVGDLR